MICSQLITTEDSLGTLKLADGILIGQSYWGLCP